MYSLRPRAGVCIREKPKQRSPGCERHAIDYPVAVDNEHVIWRAFRNQYWPALYFTAERDQQNERSECAHGHSPILPDNDSIDHRRFDWQCRDQPGRGEDLMLLRTQPQGLDRRDRGDDFLCGRARKQFAIKLVVALGIAFVGMGVIGTAIAFSAIERAR